MTPFYHSARSIWLFPASKQCWLTGPCFRSAVSLHLSWVFRALRFAQLPTKVSILEDTKFTKTSYFKLFRQKRRRQEVSRTALDANWFKVRNELWQQSSLLLMQQRGPKWLHLRQLEDIFEAYHLILHSLYVSIFSPKQNYIWKLNLRSLICLNYCSPAEFWQ